MNVSRRRLALLITTLVSASLAQTQQPPTKPNLETNSDLVLNWTDVERNIWAAAKPYLDDSLPELHAAVPELKELEPAVSQEQLGFILSRAGGQCLDPLQRTPNVISNEEVVTHLSHTSHFRQTFEYLLIFPQTPRGRMLEEYRTDKHGHAVGDQAAAGPYSVGFASMWVHLLPANQSESRFRYLGQQEMNDHKTFVVAFAQIPEMVKSPGEFQFGGTRISILYQGVAWIDSSDFRIVRMREDLLAPRPDAYLKKFTASIRFNEVRIAKAASSLWLPQEAIVEWEFNSRVTQQRHLYSHYRLFAVKTKILPAAP